MADDIDIAQEREQKNIEQALANREQQYSGESEFYCVECDAVIPNQRREALPGVDVCVGCASKRESLGKHQRGFGYVC
jgi:phage/conjugal plasmid C-4 type zinc finger TraR family protein